MRGVINLPAANYVKRALRDAEERRTSLVVIEMDTPDGLDHSMREIIQDILSSPVPVAVYLSHPASGLHLLACYPIVVDPPANEVTHIVVQKAGSFQRISMKKYRPVLAAAMALLFYTFADILVWQRIFETNQMVQYANIYHTGWFVSLAGYAILGIVFMWGAWKDCLYYLVALFVGAFSGLEDVLYYILDGKSMPESLPWLAGNPMIFHVSREGVIWSVSLWLVALVLLYLLLYQGRAKARNSFSNESESMPARHLIRHEQ